jgi:hypothetical protein
VQIACQGQWKEQRGAARSTRSLVGQQVRERSTNGTYQNKRRIIVNNAEAKSGGCERGRLDCCCRRPGTASQTLYCTTCDCPAPLCIKLASLHVKFSG